MRKDLHRWGWIGVALIAGGLPFLTQDYAPVHRGTALGALFLACGAAVLALHGKQRGGTLLAIALPVAALLTALLLNEFLRAFESGRQPQLPAFAWFAAGLARLLGESASVAHGDLLLQDSQGAFRYAPTWGAIGWRAWMCFAALGGLLAAVSGRATQRAWWIAILAALLLAMLRFAALALQYSGVDEVLARSAHAEVWTFYEPWSGLLLLLVAAVCALRWEASAQESPAQPPARKSPPLRAALTLGLGCAAVGGLAWGAALTWSDPGVSKPGRVLVDERLSGFWEPAGRMLDTERYGDFSAYSLSAMVEQLSHRYHLEVNGDRPYDAALLANVDVLVLKTPEHALAAEEIAAIRAWVEDGGGLFLISDHTDLLGMSTHLRPLAQPYGLDFAFDAVNDASGGFNLWTPPFLAEHPISAGLGPIEFMTGCSLRCSGWATPVLTLRHAASQAGDYGRSSHFGGRAPNPADPQGLLVAAAAAPAGHGRVLAFADSTILSSFAYPLFARAEFMNRGIAWLNHRDSPARHLRWAWLALGAAALVFAHRRLRGHAPALIAAGATLALGISVGAWTAAECSAAGLSVAAPPLSIPRVGFVVEGGHATLPPVLGEPAEGTPPDANFATFIQTPLRLGWEVEVVPRLPESLNHLDVLVLLNPDVEMGQAEAPPGWIEAIRAWVELGGRLVVLSRHAHLGHPHDRAPLYTAGWAFEGVSGPTLDLNLAEASPGSGRVVRVIGAEAFDVDHLGHCMQFPGRNERLHYEAAYFIFRDLLGLAAPERRTWSPR